MSYTRNLLTKMRWSMRSKAFLKSKRTAVTVAPFPSVALIHEWVILARASVVLEPGTVPNCRGSICLSTAGLTKRSTTISSANLERIDVREIGRRCLFTSRTGVCFGIGVTSACFHDCGSRASEKEQLRMSVTTGAKISAFSFNNQAGILSGPEALVGLRDASFR